MGIVTTTSRGDRMPSVPRAFRILSLAALTALFGACTNSTDVPCQSDSECTKYSTQAVCSKTLFVCVAATDAGVDLGDGGSGADGDMAILPTTCTNSTQCGDPAPICDADQ